MKVPRDTYAERVVVAVVILTRFGLERVAGIVTAGDFYEPSLAHLYEAAGQLVDVGPFLSGEPVPWRLSSTHVRIAAAATIADVPIVVVEHLVEEAVVMVDASWWARRVVEASRRREALAALSEAMSEIEDGAEVEEALASLGARP